jgi:hypothetical protein
LGVSGVSRVIDLRVPERAEKVRGEHGVGFDVSVMLRWM